MRHATSITSYCKPRRWPRSGQTISGVAHELNNPLATILSWAERLSQKTSLDPSVRRGIEIIHAESERAARIVRNLLTFARKRQTTRAMVDVNQVDPRDAGAARLRAARHEHHDHRRAGLRTADVFADGHQLQQVLLNLVINAEQAMLSANGRGILVVRIWFDAEQRGRHVWKSTTMVRDSRRMLQPKIFDPFFTTKEVGKGTGLGLTVAYAIIQEHGGRIRLESRPAVARRSLSRLPVTGVEARPAPAGAGAGAAASLRWSRFWSSRTKRRSPPP